MATPWRRTCLPLRKNPSCGSKRIWRMPKPCTTRSTGAPLLRITSTTSLYRYGSSTPCHTCACSTCRSCATSTVLPAFKDTGRCALCLVLTELLPVEADVSDDAGGAELGPVSCARRRRIELKPIPADSALVWLRDVDAGGVPRVPGMGQVDRLPVGSARLQRGFVR